LKMLFFGKLLVVGMAAAASNRSLNFLIPRQRHDPGLVKRQYALIQSIGASCTILSFFLRGHFGSRGSSCALIRDVRDKLQTGQQMHTCTYGAKDAARIGTAMDVSVLTRNRPL
jgi:hypothetical protein